MAARLCLCRILQGEADIVTQTPQLVANAVEPAALRGGMGRLWDSYGSLGLIKLALDLLTTKLLFRGVRIIRRPFYIRGKRHVDFGTCLTVGVGLRIDVFSDGSRQDPLVRIGSNVEINDYVHIAAMGSITIGDDSLIASRVFISDHNHGDLDGMGDRNGPDVPPARRPLAIKPVLIGKRVWLGEGVLVMPGVTIGDGAVVGGGAIVTRDVPAGAVVVGAPARVVRRFDPATGRWERAER